VLTAHHPGTREGSLRVIVKANGDMHLPRGVVLLIDGELSIPPLRTHPWARALVAAVRVHLKLDPVTGERDGSASVAAMAQALHARDVRGVGLGDRPAGQDAQDPARGVSDDGAAAPR
jgi:hypothetical protein